MGLPVEPDVYRINKGSSACITSQGQSASDVHPGADEAANDAVAGASTQEDEPILTEFPKRAFRQRRQLKLKAKIEGANEEKEVVSFDFEDHAAQVFRQIRRRYGISSSDFMNSMCTEPLTGGSEGEGKVRASACASACV